MEPETLSPIERLGCAFQPCNAGPGNSVLEGLEEEEEQQFSSLPPSASIPDQSRDGDTSLCQSQARAVGREVSTAPHRYMGQVDHRQGAWTQLHHSKL